MKGFSQEGYKSHMIEEHPSELKECKYCEKLFLSIGNLTGHIRKYHQKPLKIEQANEEIVSDREHSQTEPQNKEGVNKETECGRCLLKCDSKELLADHMKTHQDDSVTYKCHKCDKVYFRRHQFILHNKVISPLNCIMPISPLYTGRVTVLEQGTTYLVVTFSVFLSLVL